jgi:hypothetical protein
MEYLNEKWPKTTKNMLFLAIFEAKSLKFTHLGHISFIRPNLPLSVPI